MKKASVKKSTKGKNPSEPFTLKVWREEAFRRAQLGIEPVRAVYYTFTNKPTKQDIADFKRLLGDVPRFERLQKKPLIDCERAIRELRLADACREMHKRKLLSGI